jgi:bifunctional DNA-binding transcriptional regulator/antitoxin component of YhaV-PrlF toxin-antitoxin module
MVMARRMKISKGGQVSVPAAVRSRWRTSTVTLHDEGDRLVIRPAPDDPVTATRGVFAAEFESGPAVAELMAQRREEEAEIDERRHGHGPAA